MIRSTILALSAVLAGSARAQGPAPSQPAPMAPSVVEEQAISKECKTPAITIRGDIPLPNVAWALRERRAVRILTIGASGRAGPDTHNGGYNGRIQRILEQSLKGVEITLIDRGVSGELARDASERIKSEVALEQPDLVLWQVGTSDAFSNIPQTEFEAELTATIGWLKEHNVDIVLVGLHFIRNLSADSYWQSIRHSVNKVAAMQKVLRISRYEAGEWLEKTKSDNPDGPSDEFETTEAGYTCMAEYVARAIATAAFDPRLRGKVP